MPVATIIIPVWNGENALGRAPVGMYFVRYQAAGKSAVKRLMLTR